MAPDIVWTRVNVWNTVLTVIARLTPFTLTIIGYQLSLILKGPQTGFLVGCIVSSYHSHC